MALATFADKGGQQVTAQALDSNFATLQNEVNAATQDAQAAVSGQNWKSDVVAASTANINIASALVNGAVVDGVTLATGNRVLLIAQTDATQNGIYVVAASGAASRSTDANTSALITGTLVFVAGGTANGNKQFALTTPAPIALGTTSLIFTAVIDQGAVNASAVQPLVNQAAASAESAAASAALIYTPLPPESGYLGAFVDQNNRAAWLIAVDGTVSFAKVTLPASATVTDVPGIPLSERIFGDNLGPMFTALPPESGYLFALGDINDRCPFLVPIDASQPIQAYVSRAKNADPRNGPTADPNYVIYPEIDGSGNQQIYSANRSTGAVKKLTSSGNNVSPSIDASDNVYFAQYDANGNPTFYVVAANGSAPPIPLLPVSDLVAWGDSLLTSVGGGVDIATRVASALGRNVNVNAIPSQTTAMIAARQGGAPALITVTSNQIPASGTVNVTARSTDFLTSAATPTDTRSMTGTLAGIAGTMAKDASNNYTFTRTASGSIVACPANTPFIPDPAVANRDRVAIIWAGENDPYYSVPLATTQANILAMVAYVRPFVKHVIIMTVMPREGDTPGVAPYTGYIAINSWFPTVAATNGFNVLDIYTYLLNHGLTDAGITPTSQDLTDISNGIVPTSLRADAVHPNDVCKGLIATQIENLINSLNW